MSVKLLTEYHFESLSLKGGCTGSSDSTLVIIPHCWKSHVAANMRLKNLTYCTVSGMHNCNTCHRLRFSTNIKYFLVSYVYITHPIAYTSFFKMVANCIMHWITYLETVSNSSQKM